ncbi:MAG TPA: diacylglycerol kinase family protein [Candidatus Methylacidiphilales bacterium]|nr:diacylglycerol kinase family protein [Candidatus Methylacidiphilales bacterium]
MGFSLKERLRSFTHAFRGLGLVVRSQHNAWIHAAATVIVIVAGICTRLAAWEWCALTFAIGLVWVAETLNTALEFLANDVSREKRELIGKSKDAGAAGVLLAAICSVIIGLFVFLPHWLK